MGSSKGAGPGFLAGIGFRLCGVWGLGIGKVV